MAVYTVEVRSDSVYTTVGAGITGIVSSGLTGADTGMVIVYSGSYASETPTVNNPSGLIVLVGHSGAFVSGLYSVHSGTLQLDGLNSYFVTSTGSGDLTLKNAYCTDVIVQQGNTAAFEKMQLWGAISASGCEYVYLNNSSASGTSSTIFVSGATQVDVVSGIYSNGAAKFTFSMCSGVLLDWCYGYGYTGIPINILECEDFELNHCSFLRTDASSYILFASGNATKATSGNVNYSILASSGVFPVSGYGTVTMLAASSCFTNYAALDGSMQYDIISGTYMTRDPLFTNITTGDLRISANSPCACNADYLAGAAEASGQITKTLLNKEAIKFYIRNYETYADPQPSGIHIVQGGKAVYFPSATDLENVMDVVIYTQYTVDGDVTTVQALSDDRDTEHPFPRDYKLLPRKKFNTNEIEYYVLPYTILPLEDLIVTLSDEVAEMTVSGIYRRYGFTRDHAITSDGTPFYWIGEKTNQYLYRYSAVDNQKLDTYMLYPTGMYGTVKLSDVEYVAKSRYSAVVKTSKVYDKDHYSTRLINVPNAEGFFPFISTERDRNKELRAVVEYRDWLYLLTRNTTTEGGVTSFNTDLNIYSKYDRFPFEEPLMVISGIPNIIGENASDMTVDDEGNLYISSSGQIAKYAQKYDYALVSRTPGTVKTTLTFREHYDGVNL